MKGGTFGDGIANLPHGTSHGFGSLVSGHSWTRTVEAIAVILAAVVMIAGAVGAIALTIAARPSADRFLKW